MKYEAVIGLETHIEIRSESKMFCSCANRYGAEPNTNICPVCMGYPAGDARRPTLLNLPGAKEELLALLDEADRLSATADAVTKFRVAQDRKWLNEYWIKPNDELAEKISKAYRSATVR